jgi:SAM-dependent methyltransferase
MQNVFFYLIGLAFLTLSKTISLFRGYSSPKPFDMSDIPRCIEYDIHVVDHWLYFLHQYINNNNYLKGKTILELGPGSDLGVGIYLLSKGGQQYNACDVNDLMKSTPDRFYECFFERLKEVNDSLNIGNLKESLKNAKAGNPSKLNYVLRDDFDIVKAFGESTIDIVFSQAAFEHFDDITETISKLSIVCKPGSVLIAEIDLQTHSRWIRDKDPNNIYRFSTRLYNMFWYRAIPNRFRPFQYVEILEYNGWTDISIIPVKSLENQDRAYDGLNKDYVDQKNQMEYLSIVVCAKKRDSSE